MKLSLSLSLFVRMEERSKLADVRETILYCAAQKEVLMVYPPETRTGVVYNSQSRT